MMMMMMMMMMMTLHSLCQNIWKKWWTCHEGEQVSCATVVVLGTHPDLFEWHGPHDLHTNPWNSQCSERLLCFYMQLQPESYYKFVTWIMCVCQRVSTILIATVWNFRLRAGQPCWKLDDAAERLHKVGTVQSMMGRKMFLAGRNCWAFLRSLLDNVSIGKKWTERWVQWSHPFQFRRIRAVFINMFFFCIFSIHQLSVDTLSVSTWATEDLWGSVPTRPANESLEWLFRWLDGRKKWWAFKPF